MQEPRNPNKKFSTLPLTPKITQRTLQVPAMKLSALKFPFSTLTATLTLMNPSIRNQSHQVNRGISIFLFIVFLFLANIAKKYDCSFLDKHLYN